MKKIFVVALAACAYQASGQLKEAKVTYQRVSHVQIQLQDQGTEEVKPTTVIHKFELNFTPNQMIWKQLEEDMPEEDMGGGNRNGSFVIRTIGGGADDVTFCDFEHGRKVEAREFFDKKFLVIDSLRAGNWKIGEETKTVLGYVCHRATSQRIGKRMQMSMENGKVEHKEANDTSQVIAWFAPDIPVPAGPEIQGQLPGLIMELEINNGRNIYTAIEISPKVDLSSIKEPAKGKKVSAEEFAKERSKMMQEMQKDGQGGRTRVMVGG